MMSTHPTPGPREIPKVSIVDPDILVGESPLVVRDRHFDHRRAITTRMKRTERRMRKPLWRRGLKIVVVIVLTPILFYIGIVGCMMLFSGDPTNGHWKTDDKGKQYADTYEQALQTLPKPSEQYDVPTDFGTVRVYLWSNDTVKDKTPIVLLPGRTAGAPMWSADLPYLITERPVYALDAIGDAGMSVQTKLIESSADQARYLEQTFDYLKIAKLNLVGHSFGGYNAANYVTQYPERVASLSLIEPVFVLKGIKPTLMLKMVSASLPGAPKSWMDSAVADISGETSYNPSDPIQRMIKEGTDYYESSLPLVETITPEQASKWSMPVYIAMAQNSTKLHDPVKIAQLARQNIKLAESKVWQDATHYLPMKSPKDISAAILSNTDRVE